MYLPSAKRIAERYNKQHSTLSFVIGESVSLRIPVLIGPISLALCYC